MRDRSEVEEDHDHIATQLAQVCARRFERIGPVLAVLSKRRGTDKVLAIVSVRPEVLEEATDFARDLVCDPQTSGGLLVSVAPNAEAEVRAALAQEGLHAEPIGTVVSGEAGRLRVRG